MDKKMDSAMLSSVRVIAVTQYGAGPYALQHLADLGADVIKIERPGPGGGDYSRRLPPYADAASNDSLFFQAFNRGQRSLSLDIATPAGRELFHTLISRADVCFNNLRTSVARQLGLTYEALAPYNPAIVCCSLTGYGPYSERADEPGFDYVIQGESGIMSLAGDPDGPPVKAGVSVVDFATGIAASYAMLAGLTAARQTGRGMDVHTSLMDTALSMTNYMATWHLSAGYVPQRVPSSGHPSLVPSQVFRCADGRFLVLMVNKERFWPPLCRALGRPEWIEDPRFISFAERLRNRDLLVQALQEVLDTQPREHWIAAMRAVGVPCGPVNTLPEAFEDPDIKARTVEFAHDVFGRVVSPGPLVRTGEPVVVRRAPRLGEHSEEILTEQAGVSAQRIEALRSQGVV